MKNITIILVLGLILGIIGISGCISSGSSTNSTFSDGSISFDYPSDFTNATPGSLISGDKSWVDVKYLANSDGTAIYVQKNLKINDPSNARQITDSKNKGDVSTGEILSHTTDTNPNGITVYKSINTLKNPDDGEVLKYIDLYFKDNKGVVYAISIYDTESNYQTVSDTADVIFNSLSLK